MPEPTESPPPQAIEQLVMADDGDLLDVTLDTGDTVTGRVDDISTELDSLTGCAKRTVTLQLTDDRTLAALTLYDAHTDDLGLEHATLRPTGDDPEDAAPVGIETVSGSDQRRLADGDSDG